MKPERANAFASAEHTAQQVSVLQFEFFPPQGGLLSWCVVIGLFNLTPFAAYFGAATMNGRDVSGDVASLLWFFSPSICSSSMPSVGGHVVEYHRDTADDRCIRPVLAVGFRKAHRFSTRCRGDWRRPCPKP